MSPAAQPSAVEWLELLAAKQLSARELTEDYLQRVDRANRILNAVVALDPDRALAEADLADQARTAGDDRPLLGLPITVKDVLDVEGYRTSGGSYAQVNHCARSDATTVGRLRRAGAIVLGKTNAPEASSSGETDNAIFGRTNNPLEVTRTPGGSSGGEAAILGADASVAGVGTDGGSSIRAPSHFCGVVGLRPTCGRTAETGVWPPTRATGMLDLTCVGPIGRFVDDVALLLRFMAGPDDIDPFAVPVPLGDHAAVQLTGLRVAVYSADGLVPVTAGTSRAVAMAGAALAEAGAVVVEIQPPMLFREATEVFFGALAADGGANLIKHCQGEFAHHPQFQALLDGFASQAPSAREAYERHARLIDFRRAVRQFVSKCDLVVCPVVCGPAPLHGCPPGGVPQERHMNYEAFNFCHTYAVAGLPAVSVPVTTEGTLPVGVQVVSRAFAEDVALAAAAVVERAYGGFTIIPDRPSLLSGTVRLTDSAPGRGGGSDASSSRRAPRN